MADKILADIFREFMPDVKTLVVDFFDRIAFDADTVGRRRQVRHLKETTEIAFAQRGIPVNIAIWNMHLNEEHHFEDIIESGIVPMGNGGGFRIVTFRGEGYIKNHGDRGFENWCCSGNQWQNDNVITFGRR